MGLVFDMKRFAVHDGPGIRTTIFLKGCPLRCAWCHNPESISPKAEVRHKQIKLDGKTFTQEEIIGKEMSVEEAVKEVLKDKKYWEHSEGGVTISGGEPLLQADYTIALLKALKAENIHTCLDTCAYAPQEVVEEAAKYTDLFLFDVKSINDENHQNFTERSNQKILSNLKVLLAGGSQVHIRVPVIPGVNNEASHTQEYIQFLLPYQDKIKQIDLLPFHNTAKHKYKKESMPEIYEKAQSMSNEDLIPMQETFIAQGFTTKIGG